MLSVKAGDDAEAFCPVTARTWRIGVEVEAGNTGNTSPAATTTSITSGSSDYHQTLKFDLI